MDSTPGRRASAAKPVVVSEFPPPDPGIVEIWNYCQRCVSQELPSMNLWNNAQQTDKTKGKIMHYKNGREAKVGDKVISKDSAGNVTSGIVLFMYPATTTCNLGLAPLTAPSAYVNAGDCLHVDDAYEAVPAAAPVPAE